jgi:signal transduction histidine kinase
MNMINSLRVRLLLALIAVVVVAVGTVALLASRVTASELQRYVELDIRRNSNVIDALLAYYNQNHGAGDPSAMAQQMQAIVGERVVLTDSAGNVIGDSEQELVGQRLGCESLVSAVIVTAGRSPCVMPARAALEAAPLRGLGGQMLAEGPSERTVDSILFFGVPPANIFEYRDSQRGLFDSAAPLAGPGITILRARGPGFDPIAAGFISTVNRSLLLSVALAGLAALLLTIAFSRRILGPIEALTAAARALEKGDLGQRVHVYSKDEIGALAHAFNAMAEGLARQEQLRRHLVNDVAHELRTPLTNIRGYLEALRDGVATSSPALIDSLHDEALLLNRLVDDLQDLALAEAGQLRLARRPVALAGIVEQAVQALRPALSDKALAIGLHLPADLPCIDADAERIGQVLRNLLNNAITHTPPGGRITLSATAEDGGWRMEDGKASVGDPPSSIFPPPSSKHLPAAGYHPFVFVTVRDSGPGIAAEHLPLIFERFFRADPSRARSTGGAGLGLTIVKQLVEAHGGRVWATSAPGQGAAFTFSLPAAA